MSTLKFYTERAAECRREADQTTLSNVRERCLTAALAWENMAERVRRGETYRAADAARKAGAVDTWAGFSAGNAGGDEPPIAAEGGNGD